MVKLSKCKAWSFKNFSYVCEWNEWNESGNEWNEKHIGYLNG